jgi:hypothetical protein
MFQEWACEGATLHLVSPAGEARRLCDFRENPMSVIQRSTATPPGGLRGEVVVVDRADDPDSYAGVDVAGRFVLMTGDSQQAYRLGVVERGGLGLITDQMPEFPPVRKAMELPEATQYTSFWHNTADSPAAVGFVLSPGEGARLRRLLKANAEDPKAEPVVVEARVTASLYDGAIENVSAVIPGLDALSAAMGAGGGGGAGAAPEEVLLVAHLCHPKPSANDNASGCGTLMETARALSALITSGRLPRPRRSIRFLMVPEMTGTYAYLAENEEAIGRIVAALNLDMVGENQGLCGGPLQLEYPPLTCPDFTADLLSAVLDAVSDEGRNFAGTARYALYNQVRTPFSGGSDHYILSDPTVGVPCPMLIQFPDRFYHTSADTLDKVDPEMLARVGTMAGTYLYFWASAGPREGAWLAGFMTGTFAREISRQVDESLAAAAPAGVTTSPGADRLPRRLTFLADRKRRSLEALARIVEPARTPDWLPRLKDEISAAAAREEERARVLTADLESASAGMELPAEPPVPESGPQDTGSPPGADGPASEAAWSEVAGLVPRRVHRGPVTLRPVLAALGAERRAYWQAFQKNNRKGMAFTAQLVYWMDGHRTLAEVADCLELETGFRDYEFVAGYARLLEELGFLAWN